LKNGKPIPTEMLSWVNDETNAVNKDVKMEVGGGLKEISLTQ
jgi:hypothetical protein